MKAENKGLNILICGSQNFDLDGFVDRILDGFYDFHQNKGYTFEQVYTSQVSGACKFAREWIQRKNEELSNIDPSFMMKNKDYTFSLLNNENGHSFYDDLVIPRFILENDEMFIKGKEKIQQFNIHQVFAFPNETGIIGAHSRNIVRFAELAGVPVVDCSDLLKDYIVKFSKKYPTAEDKALADISQEKANPQQSVLALKNRHRAKTFR